VSRDIKRILFFQLPRLENEILGEAENLPIAGFYLRHALDREGRNLAHDSLFLSPDDLTLDDAHLVEQVVDRAPDLLCATLYLWNIERTLHVLKGIKKSLPKIRIVAGGPEVAPLHPFLLRSRVPDVVVAGEGEAVLPSIVAALRGGGRTDFRRVAWKRERGYEWGRGPAPILSLAQALPPPTHSGWRPDPNGLAYLETVRGCPMGCTYCRYSQMRRKLGLMTPEEVRDRVRILMDRGARNIRFVDPTLNAHPAFREILAALRRLNRAGAVEFFGEIQADALTEGEISLLAGAGFREVEAGVQSLNPQVLRSIRRPLQLAALERNLHLMGRAGITVTVDLMYGLPGQRLEDVLESLQWAKQFEGADGQCLQTLLLPGTRLRKNRRRWEMKAKDRPPYGVECTGSLSSEEIRVIEEEINRTWATDCMTGKFVGHRLPDLFEERVSIGVDALKETKVVPGVSSRRALIFHGPGLYLQREKIHAMVRQAIEGEPHMLWQFVLDPESEEPLDLIEEMIDVIRAYPPLWLDRFSSVAAWDRLASRRIFVLLKRGRSYSSSWIRAAEELLEDAFY